MVAKIDERKHGGRVRGAGELPQKAAGDGPNTGAPGRTPAPDSISAPRASHVGLYGANQYGGPSSLTPLDDANRGRSQLGVNMSQTSEGDSDPVLNAVIAKGVGAGSIDPLTGDAVTMAEGVAGTQVRKIADKNVPTHPAMAQNQQRQPSYPGPKASIPAAIGATDEQPVRTPV